MILKCTCHSTKNQEKKKPHVSLCFATSVIPPCCPYVRYISSYLLFASYFINSNTSHMLHFPRGTSSKVNHTLKNKKTNTSACVRKIVQKIVSVLSVERFVLPPIL